MLIFTKVNNKYYSIQVINNIIIVIYLFKTKKLFLNIKDYGIRD